MVVPTIETNEHGEEFIRVDPEYLREIELQARRCRQIERELAQAHGDIRSLLERLAEYAKP